jgi:hypothetical protein
VTAARIAEATGRQRQPVQGSRARGVKEKLGSVWRDKVAWRPQAKRFGGLLPETRRALKACFGSCEKKLTIDPLVELRSTEHQFAIVQSCPPRH